MTRIITVAVISYLIVMLTIWLFVYCATGKDKD